MYIYKIVKNKYYFIESIDDDISEFDMEEKIMTLFKKQRESRNVTNIYIKNTGISKLYYFNGTFAYAISTNKLNENGKIKE